MSTCVCQRKRHTGENGKKRKEKSKDNKDDDNKDEYSYDNNNCKKKPR